MTELQTIAIQGEPGSNSHIAARQMLGPDVSIVPCRLSADVIAAVLGCKVSGAVLPIENSLHGSVAEHYDLLLDGPLWIEAEGQLRIEHHLIAYPGVLRGQVRRVLSHPVALSQCRRFLAGFPQAQAVPFYDTAGSVRHLMAEHLEDAAALAPRLAADLYRATVLESNVEDYAENFTRFQLLRREDRPRHASPHGANKMSLAFALEHRPGTLVRALEALADQGADLTKIESRPVPGRPWEYIFFVDLRFAGEPAADGAVAALQPLCHMVRELGRYVAAEPLAGSSTPGPTDAGPDLANLL